MNEAFLSFFANSEYSWGQGFGLAAGLSPGVERHCSVF
jgi:hypothetical protein